MALFGEVGFQLTERWQVTVGARWFDYDDELALKTSFPFFDTGADTTCNKTGDNDVIFKFNTSFEFTPDVMGYLTISEGYRQGGLNSGPAVPGPDPRRAVVLPQGGRSPDQARTRRPTTRSDCAASGSTAG